MLRALSILLLGLVLVPAPIWADAMSAEAFDRYTRGRTLHYGSDGLVYGVERYLPNRRVIWSFLDGRCQNGHWYEERDQICFVYEDTPDPQCWTFSEVNGGLIAHFENDPGTTELYEITELDEDMLCYGPDVGV